MPKRAVLHNDDESHQIGAEDQQQNQLDKLVRRREINKQWRLRKNKSDLNNYLFDKIETCQLFGMKQQFMEWLGKGCKVDGIFDSAYSGRSTDMKLPKLNGSVDEALCSIFMGVIPTNILVSLMYDTVLTERNLEIIKKHRRLIMKVPNRENSKGRCHYYMYHWGCKNVDEGPDDFETINGQNRLLSPASVHLIKQLAINILSKLRPKDSIAEYNIYPGLLWTEKAYHQRPHIDRNENGIKYEEQSLILHLPLLEEGMMLCTWDVRNEPSLQYTPFGCFTVLKNEQVHAGCYGSDGNIRFHLVMRKKCVERPAEKDSLMTFKLKMLTNVNPNDEMTVQRNYYEKFLAKYKLLLSLKHPLLDLN